MPLAVGNAELSKRIAPNTVDPGSLFDTSIFKPVRILCGALRAQSVLIPLFHLSILKHRFFGYSLQCRGLLR